jgi:hypothetical protein
MDHEVTEHIPSDCVEQSVPEVASLAQSGLLTIDRIIADSRHILRLVVAPAGTNRGIRGVAVAVGDKFSGSGCGDLLVGVDLSSAEAVISALEEAGRNEAAALVVRADHLSASVVKSAWDSGVALLSVLSRTSWQVVYQLIADTLKNAQAIPDSSVDEVNDLFELCELYASSLGGPVAIEDSGFGILAYSSCGDVGDEYRQQAILQRHTLDDWLTTLDRKGIEGSAPRTR